MSRTKPRAKRKKGVRKNVPIWLRRLDQVRAELKGTRFPASAQEGFRQCAMLSAEAHRWLQQSIRAAMPEARAAQVEVARRRLLARLDAAEQRWLERWREERARYFGC